VDERAGRGVRVSAERILMVTPYPPVRDGIGAYALQEVKQLRAAGKHVEVLSPWPSAAHYHLPLTTARGVAELGRRLVNYDRVIVQFHPDVFYSLPCPPAQWFRITGALIRALRRGGNVEIRAHEANFDLARRRSVRGALTRGVFQSAALVSVHSAGERDRIVAEFGVDDERAVVAEHGQHFLKRVTLSQAEARAELGLPAGSLLLSIGFVQPHKGFDRGMHAFAGLGGEGSMLAVVGSVRVDDAATAAHVAALENLARTTPGVRLELGYLDDRQFDLWIVAADVVVLPYRQIWSSSVLERAALYDRPIIASRLDGLVAQAPAGTVFVEDDAELRAALVAAVGVAKDASPTAVPWPEGVGDRDAVMHEIVSRSAAARGSDAAPPGAASAAPPGANRVARSLAVRRVPELEAPPVLARNPVGRLVKKVVRRLTAWQVDPIVREVNHLRGAVIAALETEPPPASGAPPDSKPETTP
jgi:glycosyltransferase involved in cell wall biosynthesis